MEKQYSVAHITPIHGFFSSIQVRELWDFRQLLYFFVWRELKVRYRQTIVGISWVLLQPLVMMLVFSFFFGRLAKMASDGMPYALYVYTGLLPWQLFSKTLTESTQSVVNNERLVSKVYFPRVLLPTSTGMGALVDFAANLIVLFLLMAYYHTAPGAGLLAMPISILLTMLSSLGIGYWLSALNTQYRDIMYIVPLLNQILMFITPVVYSASLVPEKFRLLYALNPMVGVIELFRWSLLGREHVSLLDFLISMGVSVFLFAGGLIFFRKEERTFADYLN